MARPLNPDTAVVVTSRVSEDVAAELRAIAAAEGSTIGVLVRQFIHEALGRREAENPQIALEFDVDEERSSAA